MKIPYVGLFDFGKLVNDLRNVSTEHYNKYAELLEVEYAEKIIAEALNDVMLQLAIDVMLMTLEAAWKIYQGQEAKMTKEDLEKLRQVAEKLRK
ncbi:MAG: hypothetical protein QW680_08425 [Pyrobaculum sp.]